MSKNFHRFAEIKIGDKAAIIHIIIKKNFIAFLVSEKSNYLTVETIRVNDGKSML